MLGHGSDMEDPANTGHLNPAIGAYRCNTPESLLGPWSRTIPVEDKATWRDPAVAEAYFREARKHAGTAAGASGRGTLPAQNAEQSELERADLVGEISADQGAVSVAVTKAVSPLLGAAT